MKETSDDFRLEDSEDKINEKGISILNKNKKFFSHDRKYIDSMLEIIKGESNISIRLLDWFVSNYSKKHNTTYTIKLNNIKTSFNVYTEYKNQLTGYSKDYFDPFCRKKKIKYYYKDRDDQNQIGFHTSIGQLNFFEWAIRNRIIIYVQNHLMDIEQDMRIRTKENKESKSSSDAKTNNKNNTSVNVDDNLESDPVICSSESISTFCITPIKKSTTKSDSENKNKRQQLSKSVYEKGIIKSNKTIRLEFDY
jgi:hypothetical protein